MAVKNDIDITIGGKTITLSGVESEEYLHEVAAYLNEKLRNFSDDAAYWRLPNDMRNVMLQLNLADDYFKEHSRVLALEAQVQDLEEHRDLSVKTIEKMQGAAQEAASRISALETDAAGLRDKAQRAAAAETSATKRFGAEKSRAEKLTEEMDALRRSKAEADKAVERLRKELADTRESLQGELAKTRTDLEQKLADSESRRTKEVQELQGLRQKETKAAEEQRQREVKEIQGLRQKEAKAAEEQRRREVAELQGLREKEAKDLEARRLQETQALREQHEKQLTAAREESAARAKALEAAKEEIKKLRSGLETAVSKGENAQKKLDALEKSFADRLAADTEQFRLQAQEAGTKLEQTQEELALLQEQESARRQAAARVRASLQDLVSQYGRFGQSLEEAADQMRSLE